MVRTKKTNTAVPETVPETTPEKAPATRKDGTPRKKPVRLGPVGTLVAKASRYVKDETKAVAKAASLDKSFKAIEGTLKKWGKLPDGEHMASELLDIATALREAGFVPATGVATAEKFVEGDLVELKPDFVEAFKSVYSDVEIGSMSYYFFDDVSKMAQCKTDGRMMIVKLRQIQARTVAPTA